MLIGISPLIGPDLLATLSRMGHGDELVLADAHFPAESIGRRVVRADGLRIADLLDGILRLLALDSYVPDPIVMMAAEPVRAALRVLRPGSTSVRRGRYRRHGNVREPPAQEGRDTGQLGTLGMGVPGAALAT